MEMKKKYKDLLKAYPSIISKQKLCKICHMSPRSALYALKSGLIPCTDNGKKTHRYSIAMRDVIKFLQARDSNPHRYYLKENLYMKKYGELEFTEYSVEELEQFYRKRLKEYNDILSIKEIEKITGYCNKTIYSAIKSGQLRTFKKGTYYKVPKAWLISYMASKEYNINPYASAKHRKYISEFLLWDKIPEPEEVIVDPKPAKKKRTRK